MEQDECYKVGGECANKIRFTRILCQVADAAGFCGELVFYSKAGRETFDPFPPFCSVIKQGQH